MVIQCVKRVHRNICTVFSAPSPQAHVMSPLKYHHFFLCSLLQVYPMRSLFRHRHVIQGYHTTWLVHHSNCPCQIATYHLTSFICHSLHRTTFIGKYDSFTLVMSPFLTSCGFLLECDQTGSDSLLFHLFD